jgi:uncharacterized phage protein (TIGR02218 family)
MRFTAHDADLSVQEGDNQYYTYKSADSFKMTALETESGLAVSNMDAEVLIDDATITDDDLIEGFYDQAKVEFSLAYWSVQGVLALPLRVSWIGEITIRGVSFKADLRGISQKLQQVFTESTSLECRYQFCDAVCKLDPAAYTRHLHVTSLEANDTFYANIATIDYNKFQWGLATWTSGNNAGAKMEIVRNGNDRIQLFLPMSKVIQVGDTVDLLLGCDKSFAACKGFSNSIRFGGEPFLAGSDLLMTYPVSVEGTSDSGSKF